MNDSVRSVLRSPVSSTVAGVLLLAAALAIAWGNSLAGPLVFDDIPSLRENPSIRQLATALSPPGGGLTVCGRPVLNLSFALNYAIGGDDVRGYHVLNLCLHFLSALTLFGLVRRTLRLPALSAHDAAHVESLALAIAVIWAVHPLQTESVTYLIQRAESLAGLFYLLTLYCFVRGVGTDRPVRWLTAGAASCLLGSLTKETIATAPLVVLLYDRTFVSGSFRGAWSRHRGFYAALLASWVVLGCLVFATKNRGGTTGFATPITPWEYIMIQGQAVPHYLRLYFWPDPLVLDYGPYQSVPPGAAFGALVVGTGLAMTGWALWRHPVLGFLGGCFFLTLAPSSSLVPVASQVMAEHRNYLALAAVVALVMVALQRSLGRYFPAVALALVVVCVARTAQRNRDYRSAVELWTANVRDFPSNPRAFVNLGVALAENNQWAEAATQYNAALRLQPNYVAARYNLGLVSLQQHQYDAAQAHFATTLRLNPAMVDAAYSWGNALAANGHPAEAAVRFEQALRLKPDHAQAHFNLGNALVELGRVVDAIPHYRESLRLAPNRADVHFNLGNALAQTGRFAEAATEYEAVLRLTPVDAEAARNLAAVRQAAIEGGPR